MLPIKRDAAWPSIVDPHAAALLTVSQIDILAFDMTLEMSDSFLAVFVVRERGSLVVVFCFLAVDGFFAVGDLTTSRTSPCIDGTDNVDSGKTQ